MSEVTISHRAACYAAHCIARSLEQLSEEIRLAANGANYFTPEQAEQCRKTYARHYIAELTALDELLQVV